MRVGALASMVVLIALFQIVRAEDNNAEQVQLAKKFIEKLGADSYSDRLEARERLMKLGRPAIEPLESAMQTEDAEIRLRAIEILMALRGRGFLGIGLAENNPGAPPNPELEIETYPVRATQILEAKNFVQYGVTYLFPAESANLQIGDRIITVNGRPIHGVKDLLREVVVIGPARIASLLIERDSKPLRLALLLTRNPLPVMTTNIVKEPLPVDLEKELQLQNNPQILQRKSVQVENDGF
ncbi:MAG: PDZ domain-containing protein [Planctomycetota bacterium]